MKTNQEKNRALDRMFEWYRVYETRMAINLLEPWEKCLANSLIVLVLSLMSCLLVWVLGISTQLVVS